MSETLTENEMKFVLHIKTKHRVGRAYCQRLAHIYPGVRFPNASLCRRSKQPQWTELAVFYWGFDPVCQSCLTKLRKIVKDSRINVVEQKKLNVNL